MQILGASAFDKTPIEELLTEIKDNQNVKELYNLFNVNFNASVVVNSQEFVLDPNPLNHS